MPDVAASGRNIGVVDIAMDPSNPEILYAATYDRMRKPWTYMIGGPGSGLKKKIRPSRRGCAGSQASDSAGGRTRITTSRPQPGETTGLSSRPGPGRSKDLPLFSETTGMRSEARHKCQSPFIELSGL